ncbi:WGR domain-containing protein [Candidatus Acetothermia bacterium]|nr:WGR domain-containing protein [Candidatus Acetothermia bacterium]MBI3459430.1 WGR domain-containing protein [Candidatus Acetothermia bacterium]
MGNTLRWQSIDPANNRFRFYTLSLSVDLWGEPFLVQHWGRIGSKGRRKFVWLQPEELDTYVQGILRQRELDGYKRLSIDQRNL